MELKIGKQKLRIKDYYCADGDGIYLPKEDAKLWLYVHLTDACNASCPFASMPRTGESPEPEPSL